MAGEDVIVTVGVDASTANTTLAASQAKFTEFGTKASASLDKVDKSVVRVEKSAKAMAKPVDEAAAAQAKLRAESEKLEKVASLLGPNLGGLVSTVSKLGKAAGSDVGGATLAIGGLAAGLGAGLYALGQFASMTLDTIQNVDDLADSLDNVTRNRLAPQIASLRESKAALADAADGWTELKIVAADAADGPLSDLASLGGRIAEGWALVGENARKAGGDLTYMLGPAGSVLKDLHNIKELMDKADEWWARREQKGGGQTMPMDGSPLDLPMSIPPEAPAAPTAAPPKQTSTNRPARVTARPVDDAILSSLSLPNIDVSKSQYDLKAAGLAAMADLDQQYADKRVALAKETAEAIKAEIERETAARQAAVQTGIAAASQLGSSLIGIAGQIADAQVASTKEGTAAHRQAMRDQLTVQEAAAIANAALGITNIWSQWAGQPIVAGALTAVEAVATGLAIGQIEQQKSKLHSGGLAPDEQMGLPALITRENERAAILTDEGRRRITADDIDRANAGRVPDTLQIVVRDESGRGRAMSARQFGRPMPGVGQSLRGVR